MNNKEIMNYLNLNREQLDLLQLLFKVEVSPAEIAGYFQKIDIEKVGLETASHIAHLCIKANYQGVPSEFLPRINGIIKFCLFHNARQMINALPLIQACQYQGIPILLCVGTAMRLGYMPKVSRNMWAVNIAVPAVKYLEAIQLAEKMGYEADPAIHATNLRKNNQVAINIRPGFYKKSLRYPGEDAGVWQRSRQINANGVQSQLPSVEDMLIQILNSLMWDMAQRSTMGQLTSICDSLYLINHYPEINWSRLCGIACEAGIEHQICFCLEMINSLFPEIIDYPLLEQRLMGGHGSRYKLKQLIKQRAAVQRYGHTQETDSFIACLIKWTKLNWYGNCFSYGGSHPLENILSFPGYLKKYW